MRWDELLLGIWNLGISPGEKMILVAIVFNEIRLWGKLKRHDEQLEKLVNHMCGVSSEETGEWKSVSLKPVAQEE